MATFLMHELLYESPRCRVLLTKPADLDRSERLSFWNADIEEWETFEFLEEVRRWSVKTTELTDT